MKLPQPLENPVDALAPTSFLFWRSLAQLISWGSTIYLFGLLVQPVEAALQVTRGQTSFAFGLAMLTEGFLAYPVGRWIDAGRGREVMAGGSVGYHLTSGVEAVPL